MSSLRGPLGACWGSGRLPPPGKNESPAQHGAFRCFRLVRRTLTVHERGEIGCQRGEQDNQEKADEQGDDERNGGAVHGAERHARHFLHDEEADAERRRDGGHVVQNRDDDAEPDQIPAENLRNGHEDRHADEQQCAERPYGAAFGRREHAAVNAADNKEEDAHDGQPRLERGHSLVEGGFGQPRGEARLEEDHEPHRGHGAQRAVVVPRFLVAGHTVVLEVVQDVPVDVGEIQREGWPVPFGEFPVRPLDEQVARADFHQGVVLAHIARAEGVDALRAAAGDAVHAGAAPSCKASG